MTKHTLIRCALVAGLPATLWFGAPAGAQTEAPETCRASDGADALPGTEDDTLECGRGADASADEATAIGTGAVASHASSVALGAGSTTSAPDTVSVGNADAQRRLTHVAGGIDDSDAATMGQLNAVISAAANPVDLTVANAIAIDDVTTRAIPTSLNGFPVPADIGQIYIGNTTPSADAITIDSGANFPGGMAFRRYLGTPGDPQPVTPGTQLGYLDFRGYNEGFFFNVGSLDVVVDTLIFDTSGEMPTKMRFATSNGQTIAVGMELLSNGRLEINALGNPVGALGNSKLYVFQGGNDWNTVLSSSPAAGSAYVLRVHTAGTGASDYLIGGSSGEGTGSFKFSVRGNGDTHIAGKLLVQGRDVLSELTALSGQSDVSLEQVKFGSAGTANASGDGALAVGGAASATGTRATAVGASSQATAVHATAIGSGAAAIRSDASALGSNAVAQGDMAVAVGSGAVSVGDNAVALGGGARATVQTATAVGAVSQATSAGATAVGNNSKATRVDAVALGNGAVAVADRGVALGSGSVASHAGSAAVGAGARTTASNQVMLGAKGTSVVVADIASSTAAQQGPVDAVTVDANGVLGRQRVATAQAVENVRSSVDHIAAVTDAQFAGLSDDLFALGGRVDAIEQRVALLDDRVASSTAIAVAMGGGTFLPNQRFNLTANIGTYDGAHAGAFQIGALLNDHVAVNAGVATGFNKNGKTAGRVGVTLGF